MNIDYVFVKIKFADLEEGQWFYFNNTPYDICYKRLGGTYISKVTDCYYIEQPKSILAREVYIKQSVRDTLLELEDLFYKDWDNKSKDERIEIRKKYVEILKRLDDFIMYKWRD